MSRNSTLSATLINAINARIKLNLQLGCLGEILKCELIE